MTIEQKTISYPIPTPLFGLGYLITLVFIDTIDLNLFKKINTEYTDIVSSNFNFQEVILPLGRKLDSRKLEDIINTEDELSRLRTKIVQEYPEVKRKTVLLVTQNIFNSSKAYESQSDNVFNLRIKQIKAELPRDTLNIELEVIKFRGSHKDIRGTKFSVNIPNIN